MPPASHAGRSNGLNINSLQTTQAVKLHATKYYVAQLADKADGISHLVVRRFTASENFETKQGQASRLVVRLTDK